MYTLLIPTPTAQFPKVIPINLSSIQLRLLLNQLIMSPSDKVTGCFMYVADKRPVLAFHNAGDALAFQKGFHGAEIYNNKTHVFLPTPHGLEFVCGGKNGETAYGMHLSSFSQF